VASWIRSSRPACFWPCRRQLAAGAILRAFRTGRFEARRFRGYDGRSAGAPSRRALHRVVLRSRLPRGLHATEERARVGPRGHRGARGRIVRLLPKHLYARSGSSTRWCGSPLGEPATRGDSRVAPRLVARRPRGVSAPRPDPGFTPRELRALRASGARGRPARPRRDALSPRRDRVVAAARAARADRALPRGRVFAAPRCGCSASRLAPRPGSVQDSDHVVAVFRVRGHWGAIASPTSPGCAIASRCTGACGSWS